MKPTTSKPGRQMNTSVRSLAIPYLTKALIRRFGSAEKVPTRITRRTMVVNASGRKVSVENYLRWEWIFDIGPAAKLGEVAWLGKGNGRCAHT